MPKRGETARRVREAARELGQAAKLVEQAQERLARVGKQREREKPGMHNQAAAYAGQAAKDVPRLASLSKFVGRWARQQL